MREIGVRELKASLSQTLRAVGRGRHAQAHRLKNRVARAGRTDPGDIQSARRARIATTSLRQLITRSA